MKRPCDLFHQPVIPSPQTTQMKESKTWFPCELLYAGFEIVWTWGCFFKYYQLKRYSKKSWFFQVNASRSFQTHFVIQNLWQYVLLDNENRNNTKHKPASLTSVKSSDRVTCGVSLVHLFFPPPNPILPYPLIFPLCLSQMPPFLPLLSISSPPFTILPVSSSSV